MMTVPAYDEGASLCEDSVEPSASSSCTVVDYNDVSDEYCLQQILVDQQQNPEDLLQQLEDPPVQVCYKEVEYLHDIQTSHKTEKITIKNKLQFNKYSFIELRKKK